MKVVNQYVVTYKMSLCTLLETEDAKFYIEFNEYSQQCFWKKQIKEIPTEDALLLINQ